MSRYIKYIVVTALFVTAVALVSRHKPAGRKSLTADLTEKQTEVNSPQRDGSETLGIAATQGVDTLPQHDATESTQSGDDTVDAEEAPGAPESGPARQSQPQPGSGRTPTPSRNVARNPTARSGDDSHADDDIAIDDSASRALPAIRLSEDFKLPAAVMALALPASQGGIANRSKQVQAAARGIVDDFYRDVAKQAAASDGWQDQLQTDPETGESTFVVTPSPVFDQARRTADERFRLLFGDSAFNAYLVKSGVERMMDETTSSPSR